MQARAIGCRFDPRLPSLIAEACSNTGGARHIERWLEERLISPIAERLLQSDEPNHCALNLYARVDNEGEVTCELA